MVNLIQCKISDSGESMVFNYGWSGNETRNATFYSDWIPYMMLYQALNDNREFGGGSAQNNAWDERIVRHGC